jgi:hypothetical protein
MRELEGKAAGDERAFIPQVSTGGGRLGVSDTMPGTAGGEPVTGPLNCKR